jgi:hypothetical protein
MTIGVTCKSLHKKVTQKPNKGSETGRLKKYTHFLKKEEVNIPDRRLRIFILLQSTNYIILIYQNDYSNSFETFSRRLITRETRLEHSCSDI